MVMYGFRKSFKCEATDGVLFHYLMLREAQRRGVLTVPRWQLKYYFSLNSLKRFRSYVAYDLNCVQTKRDLITILFVVHAYYVQPPIRKSLPGTGKLLSTVPGEGGLVKFHMGLFARNTHIGRGTFWWLQRQTPGGGGLVDDQLSLKTTVKKQISFIITNCLRWVSDRYGRRVISSYICGHIWSAT